MILESLLFVAGLFCLVKGADFLVAGSASMAKRADISDLAIGLTVVSFGTSAPELLVNIVSATKGYSDISFANVLGSNNFNTLFVLGLAGVVSPLAIHRNTVRFEIPIFIFVNVLLFVLVNDHLFSAGRPDYLERSDSLILFISFGLFIFYVYHTRKIAATPLSTVRIYKTRTAIALLLLGLAMLAAGGELTISSAVKIAKELSISDRIIGLTILAMGTSLPELATSMVAIYKQNTGIAMGNAIGSNIFNICIVLGVVGAIRPAEYNLQLNFDLYVSLASGIMLLIFMFTINRSKLDRYEALLLMLCYIAYAFVFTYVEFMR